MQILPNQKWHRLPQSLKPTVQSTGTSLIYLALILSLSLSLSLVSPSLLPPFSPSFPLSSCRSHSHLLYLPCIYLDYSSALEKERKLPKEEEEETTHVKKRAKLEQKEDKKSTKNKGEVKKQPVRPILKYKESDKGKEKSEEGGSNIKRNLKVETIVQEENSSSSEDNETQRRGNSKCLPSPLSLSLLFLFLGVLIVCFF